MGGFSGDFEVLYSLSLHGSLLGASKSREAGTGIEPVSSGFADRGLTTWLPRRILLPEPIRWLSPFTPYGTRRQLLPIFENSANLGACQGQGLRIVPYAGHKGYQCYLDGWKVNGKRKRLYLKDEATAAKKLAELAKQQKQEGQAGLDVPLELRVMAVKAAKRLAPFNKSVLDAAEFYATHLERECSSVQVSAAIEGYLNGKERSGLSQRHLRDIRGRIGRFNEAFGPRLIRTMSVREIEDWFHGISLAPQSVVNYRAVVHAFFEHCVKRSLVERNPIAAIDKVKLVDKAPEILSPEQLFNLLSAAPLTCSRYLLSKLSPVFEPKRPCVSTGRKSTK